MSDKIKVVGYAKRDFFGNGIEYRNFTPDLVGLQTTSNSSALLFTMGNFAITTNMDPKNDKTFITNSFSNFVSLTDLNLTLNQTQTLLADNTNTILNLDKTNLKYYALFGSLSEFVRVSLEDIITKWPASLFMNPVSQTSSGQVINGNTYENYTYDEITEIATFKVDTNFITNKFQINYLTNGTIIDTYNATNDVRNLTVNYNSYVIFLNDIEYPVIDFTGSTYLTNDYICFTVKGNVFSGLSTSARINYHIKPSNTYKDAFFNALPDFEYYLLSRNITPIYTAVFKFPTKSDTGDILYVSKSLTWPVSDGYNIDFDTTSYIDYVTQLLEISSNNDLYSSDLMNRFLVTESISDFDTTPVHVSDYDADTTGQKMNKTLHVYGREFDDINNFISGIAFANVVSYNKQDNTPDKYLKNLANVLGWGIISSVTENDLLSNYIKPSKSTYSGESVGLTPVEADIELWRRIILNTPWIWKSKGARKSIEFLLRFIGVPQGLVKFNEYVYIADKPIDMIQFSQILELNGLNTDLTTYPIDSDGYPSPLPDTDEMYFQGNGLWYRETGGANSTIDILTGNNPHLGPYDGGFKYINQFKELIPNFSAVTITSETTTIDSNNIYYNNQLGTFNESVESSTIDSVVFTSISGHNISTCFDFSATVEIDPLPSEISNNCGCTTGAIDKIMSVCIKNKNAVNTIPSICGDKLIRRYEDSLNGIFVFEYYQYNPDGTIFTSNGLTVPYTSNYTSVECCTYIGGLPMLHETIENDIVVDSGYFCHIIPIETNYIIDAVNDTGASISGTTGGQALANVLVNDTLNGITATLSSVTLTQTSTTNPYANINVLNGSVNIDSNSFGDYVISYQICEIAKPTNCDIATVSGTILNYVIDAVDDSGASVTGDTGGVSVVNILSNDTFNGGPATISNVTITQLSTTNTGVTINTSNGSVNVVSGTSVGIATLEYKICEIANPNNCDTATITVPVVNSGVVIVDADYMVLTYEFSDGRDLDTRTRVVSPNIGQINNCNYVGWNKQSSQPINLSGWSQTSIPSNYLVDWAGDNTGTGFESVLINLKQIRLDNPTVDDLLIDCRAYWYGTSSLVPVNLKSVFYLGGTMAKGTPLYQYTNTGYTSMLEFIADGVSVISGNTPTTQLDGQRVSTFSYNFITKFGYFNNADVTTPLPNNCIIANDDTGVSVYNGTGGVSVANVLSNDTLNAIVVTTSNVTISQISSTSTGVTINISNGSVNVASTTSADTYSLVYQICETANPTNCDTATVTVPVLPTPLLPTRPYSYMRDGSQDCGGFHIPYVEYKDGYDVTQTLYVSECTDDCSAFYASSIISVHYVTSCLSDITISNNSLSGTDTIISMTPNTWTNFLSSDFPLYNTVPKYAEHIGYVGSLSFNVEVDYDSRINIIINGAPAYCDGHIGTGLQTYTFPSVTILNTDVVVINLENGDTCI